MTKRLTAGLLASTVLTLAASVSPPARATNYVVALAAKPQAGAKDAIAELLQGLYRKFGPGDTIVAYNATDSREIARIDVPQNPAIATNRNYKAKAINETFAKLWDFVDAGGEGAPGDAGAIAIPRLLISLAAIRDALPGKTAEAIAVGSMLYSDAREPTFSMEGGFVPTDAHLRLTQDQSPYGVAGRDQALQGVAVHFCYTNPADDWTTDVFRQRVGRLWALSTILQGGRFGSYGPLDRACIDNFLSGASSSENFAVDRADTKPTMRKYGERATVREPVEVAGADTAAPASAETLFQRPPCATAPASFVGPLRIGIKWDCPSCDLDLYARSRPQSEWLYYGHRLPADGNGFFDHDFTAPPPGGDAYEYIQFNSVDLHEVAARVNFYGGSAPGGPSFRLRVWFAGCAYDAPPQRIAATTGNGGGSDPTDWRPIDVLGVVGLRDRATHAEASAHRLAGDVDVRDLCHVNGLANGKDFRFLVDSAATALAFDRRHIPLLGINPASLHFDKKVETANGDGVAAAFTLHELRLGTFTLHDVPALIGNFGEEAILGRSIVKLMHFEIGNGTCALLWP